MVFGCKPKKPKSKKPGDKRKLSLLNSDFKSVTGITNNRLKQVATHTLSPCQLAMGDDRRIHHGINQARDAIMAAGQGREGVGILDNDYMAAFDFMVLLWVLMVLKAKGMAEEAIKHLTNLYSNHFSIVVVNNVLGRKFENKRWSIRQGDRPSSILFCYGIDPHLAWLEKRLRGIPIYSMPAAGPVLEREPFPLVIVELYKVVGYIDDVKPAITAMDEFALVDSGSSLFEKASGCILHRNPASGKVKFLPLGRWRGTLCQEDMPVNYIAISDHLDMIGVQLKATHTQTRKVNGDSLVDKVKTTMGPWKGGKFLPLSLRCHSANTYCLPKVWFKCASIDLRVGDAQLITSNVKSWVYADQLIKPEEVVLYKPRQEGGLNLVNVKYRAMAELIKSFLDTAINPTFRRNIYHQALFHWHVESLRSIPDPGKPAYYTAEFFNAIKAVKEDGLLQLKSMSIGMWYRALLEKYVTKEEDDNGFLYSVTCRAERVHADLNWETIWSFSILPGLNSDDSSFLFKLLHNLLTTQERLHRVLSYKVTSSLCTLCTQEVCSDQMHALIYCPFNNGMGYWLVRSIRKIIPQLQPLKIITLDFGSQLPEEQVLPVIWLTAKTLQVIWMARIHKKSPTLTTTRAALEAHIMLLRKTRHNDACGSLKNLIAVD